MRFAAGSLREMRLTHFPSFFGADSPAEMSARSFAVYVCPKEIPTRTSGAEASPCHDNGAQLKELIRSIVLEVLRVIPIAPPTPVNDRAEWLTTHQAAHLLQICPTSLEKARSTGLGPLATIPHHKIGRSVRYRRADVLDAVAPLRVPGRVTRA